ncbi:hypothetical protein AC062_1182 [Pasteurellaceae bacterium NI1060]|nr:hypothetical protein AC062_1182 [Pasteurellaceae bacterium NI1060]
MRSICNLFLKSTALFILPRAFLQYHLVCLLFTRCHSSSPELNLFFIIKNFFIALFIYSSISAIIARLTSLLF